MSAPRPEWLGALLPLGVGDGKAWHPVGVGTLLIEREVLWLATPTSVLAKTGGQPLVTWPTPRLALTLEDLPESGLAWIPHPEYDLAVRPFPATPAWALRAFSPTQCAAPGALEAGQRCLSAGYAYALAADGPPGPTVLEGAIASIDDPALALVTSAPLLPSCLGSPLLVHDQGLQALAGLLVKRLWLPQDDAQLPPLQLTVALSSAALIGLIRSPAALEHAERASRGGPS